MSVFRASPSPSALIQWPHSRHRALAYAQTMASPATWGSKRSERVVCGVNVAGATAAAVLAGVGLARSNYVQPGSSTNPLANFWAASSAVRTWAIAAPLLIGMTHGRRPARELLTVAGFVQLGDAALGVWQGNTSMAVLPAAVGLVHLESARRLD